ncbi:ATP-binding cassette domain-containing protein [bacterium]|nr:ATP-binding cassette domain-containing protein [bacterium]
MDGLLEVSHLRKTFNGSVVAVDDLSFHVDEGEVFGLVGPNGAGKTTTMTMLAGLTQPDCGSISLQGRLFDPALNEHRLMLGMVPQNLVVYLDLTALENLRFFGSLYGLRGSRLKQRVDAVLELTGLTARATDLVKTFSGGMQRRLNFGIALLHQPRLLILDEPTVGVDPQSRAHLLDAVQQLSRQGVSVLYASHYMEEVAAICHRVAIVDHGRILQCGTLPELLSVVRHELRLLIAPTSPGLVDSLHQFVEVEPPVNGELVARLMVDGGVNRNAQKLDHTLREVMDVLQNCDAELLSIEAEEHNLERLFLQLTGNRLRD